MPAFGQQFLGRVISPSQASEIVGDLGTEFCAAFNHGDYMRRVAIPSDSTPAGVPLGIYFDITTTGRAEWNKPIYKPLYE